MMASTTFKYELDVFHRLGVKHQAATSLLPFETDGLDQEQVHEDITVFLIEQKPATVLELIDKNIE